MGDKMRLKLTLVISALGMIICAPAVADGPYFAVTAFVGGTAAHPCPKAWHAFQDAGGRVLIGAGYFKPKDAQDARFYPTSGENPAQFTQTMKARGLQDNILNVDGFKTDDPSSGGQDSVTLNLHNIPALTVVNPTLKQASSDPNGSHYLGQPGSHSEDSPTSTTTNNLDDVPNHQPVALDIRPRYIAIYYCESDKSLD